MADAIQIKGGDEVITLLSKMPDHLLDVAREVLRDSMFAMQKKVKGDFGKNGKLQVRTGDLARSIQFTTSGQSLGSFKASFFTRSIYAPIQEVGGKIKAIDKFTFLDGTPYLAIPSDINKTAAGVTRLSPTDAFSIRGQTRIIKLRAGGKARYMILDRDMGPIFWLVNEVEIPPRLGMQKAADDEIPTIMSRFNELLLEGL